MTSSEKFTLLTVTGCFLCPRICGVDRKETPGFCGVSGDKIRINKVMIHRWEEPCISGKGGAGAVFFSGCNLRCVYCQNYDLSHKVSGTDYSVAELADIFRDLEARGADNIDLVTPTHYADKIAAALDIFRPGIPVIWNSSGYERTETLRLLEGYVDVYLPDMKYISPEKALRYSAAEDYFDTAARALAEMCRQTGPALYDENGMIKKGTLVRHLVLPGATGQSVRLLKWLSGHLPEGVPVSIMGQYTPAGELTDFPELQRKLTREEYRRVTRAAENLGLTDGYIQSLSSSSEEFIPEFN